MKRPQFGMALATAWLAAGAAQAQQPAPPPAPPAPTPVAVGTEAPDFVLPASTRQGVSRKPLRLRDLRGRTVVLAFFFKARTSG